MALICSMCSKEVPAGFGHCPACNQGFLNQLICGNCGDPVPRGMNACSPCARSARLVTRNEGPVSAELVTTTPQNQPPMAMSVLPRPSFGVPGAIVVPEEYQAGKLGVSATVQIPQEHVNALNELGKMIALLHQMANKLVVLPGEGVRRIAKGMRSLATDIQEEIETRVGPQS